MYTLQGQQHAQRSPQHGRCLENLYNGRNPNENELLIRVECACITGPGTCTEIAPAGGKHVQRKKPQTKSVFQELIRAGCVYSIVLTTGTEITPARTLEKPQTKYFFLDPRDADPNWVCVQCSASNGHRYGPSQDAGENECTTGEAPNKIGFSGVDSSRVCLH